MLALLALISGALLGYVLERGDFCFHSTLRGPFRHPPQLDLLRAYLLMVLLSAPLLWGMRAVGWIDPWIPPFHWQANLVGGLLFGIGMVVASSCVSGLFYKLGHGMLGALVGLHGWGAGDLLIYLGPLRPLREALTIAELPAPGAGATIPGTLGVGGWLLIAASLLFAMRWLWGASAAAWRPRGKLWGWFPLGLGLTAVIVAAWIGAAASGVDYPFGTASVPSQLLLAIREGARLGWIPLALLGLLPGAYLAARRAGTHWLRGERPKRYLELGAGGLLMGIAAGIAGGCNLGHSLIGVPLLSLGSLTTTLSMLAGVFLAHTLNRRLAAGSLFRRSDQNVHREGARK